MLSKKNTVQFTSLTAHFVRKTELSDLARKVERVAWDVFWTVGPVSGFSELDSAENYRCAGTGFDNATVLFTLPATCFGLFELFSFGKEQHEPIF